MEPGWVAAALAKWYAGHARPLPWRRLSDPYRVLVAEFILQQTRMETGLAYYRRFLRRFPTLEALAAARPSEVLAQWSGLGYYARARNLHATARRLRDEHGGRVPSDPATLRGLPGIGPYTAGAIASIAFDRPEPALDGNQVRVLGRLLGIRDASSRSARRRLEAWSRRLLAHGSPRVLNQALMDVGSQICVSGRPRCEACPLVARCPAARHGRLIRNAPRRVNESTPEAWTALVRRRGARLWLVPPKGQGLLAGLWLPPLRRAGGRVAAPHVVHRFSHKQWAVRFLLTTTRPPGRGKWVGRDELAALPHSRLTRRAFDWVGPPVTTSGARPGR